MKRLIYNLSIITLLVFNNLTAFSSIKTSSGYYTFIQKIDVNRQQYDKHIKEGDRLLNEQKYELAMKEYQAAARLYPSEEYPQLKMQFIETTLGMLKYQKQQEEAAAKEKQKQEEALKQKEAEAKKAEEQAALDTTSLVTEEETISKEELEAIRRDSLKKAIIESYADTLLKLDDKKHRIQKSLIYTLLGEELQENDFSDLALEYFKKALMIEDEGEAYLDNVATVYEGMGNAYYNTGQFDNSIETYEKSMDAKKELGDKKGESDALTNIGTVYETTYDIDKAIDYYEKSAQLKDSISDTKGKAEVMDNLGNLYYKQKILTKSIDAYKESAELSKKTNDDKSLGNAYNKIGSAYYELGKFDDAEEFLTKSVEIKQKTGENKDVSLALNNLGNLNYEQSKYKKAIEYYEQSLDIKTGENYTYGKAISFYNLGNTYRQTNDYEKAISLFENSKKIAKENKFEELYARNTKVLSELYGKIKNDVKLAEAVNELASLDAGNIDIDDNITEIQIKSKKTKDEDQLIKYLTDEILKQKELLDLEAEQRDKENKINLLKLQKRNEQIKRQKLVLYSLTSVILLVLSLVFILFKQNRQRRKTNLALTEKNTVISRQQKLITDNIVAASAIQKASLPPEGFIDSHFPEHFVLYIPKDIVSGDFYWADTYGEDFIIVAADCTGHGVSGALVSMLGISLFNEIVHKKGKKSVGELLDEVNLKIKESLHQKDDKNEELREGMDLAICRLNKAKNKCEFAGANNPLIIVRNKEIIEQKGDRSPIGYWNKGKKFTTYEFELQPGDSIYMFSDGYIDQLSGETYKKFLSKRFKELLIEINDKPLQKQKEILHKNFQDWRGTYQQVDDILVMGLKV